MSTHFYDLAKEQYAALGVDTDAALQALDKIPVSMHCWQGDDVAGFEAPEKAGAGNGCIATGNYPGKASAPKALSPTQPRADRKVAMHGGRGKTLKRITVTRTTPRWMRRAT